MQFVDTLLTFSKKGWLALGFLALSVLIQSFFNHGGFEFRAPGTPTVVDLQLAFTVTEFKMILATWRDLAVFKQNLWQLDFLFPLAYAGLLAFGYAWSKNTPQPTKWDRRFFCAPLLAAIFDCVENTLHLILLRNIARPEQVPGTDFPAGLVFAASICASLKILLLAVVVAAILFWLGTKLFPYAYLLRVPLLTAAALVGVVYLAFFTGARSLLENLFELTTWGIFGVSLVAFLLAWTVMATARLVLWYGPERFAIDAYPGIKTFGWSYLGWHGLVALPVVMGAIWKSAQPTWKGYTVAVLAAALGLAASLAVLWVATWTQRRLTPQTSQLAHLDLLLPSPQPAHQTLENAAAKPVPRHVRLLQDKLQAYFSWLGAGYVDPHSGEVLPGHGLALALFLLSLLIYGIVGWAAAGQLGASSHIPALAYALWLLLLLGWILSGMSFFLDRYRLPVLIPLAIWLALSAQLPYSDHYYRLLPFPTVLAQTPQATPPTPANQPLSPAEAMQAKPSATQPLIVVAVAGGGIQAAAWAAQVLTGLEQENPGQFGRHIRLLSAVSGGSVGAMYFANAYQPDGTLDLASLPSVVNQAMHSSLNAVGWGLAYPDFLRVACLPCVPFIREIDRGQALEQAWLLAEGIDKTSLPTVTLAQWKADAQQGRRPFVIFNTTITDTGERLLIATSAPKKSLPNQPDDGSRDFSDIYPQHDLKIVTAARLSAAFPYASPAARADLSGPQYHIVDGGYYDNYGIASLTQWLSQALPAQPSGPKRRVLIVQIRAFPTDEQADARPATQRGWFYQAFAPVSTLLSVRTTGQAAHNQIELTLLREVLANRGIAMQITDFEFKHVDKDPHAPPPCKNTGMNYYPPLSWHLTPQQKDEIRQEWARVKGCGEANKVKEFLNPTPMSTNAVGGQQ